MRYEQLVMNNTIGKFHGGTCLYLYIIQLSQAIVNLNKLSKPLYTTRTHKLKNLKTQITKKSLERCSRLSSLGYPDSNQDKQDQNLLYYPYTIAQ